MERDIVQAFREFCQLKSTDGREKGWVLADRPRGPLHVNGTHRNVLGRGSFANWNRLRGARGHRFSIAFHRPRPPRRRRRRRESAQLPGATRFAASRIFPFSAESAPRASLRPIHESTPVFLHLGGEGDICHGHLSSQPPPLDTSRSIKERREGGRICLVW